MREMGEWDPRILSGLKVILVSRKNMIMWPDPKVRPKAPRE